MKQTRDLQKQLKEAQETTYKTNMERNALYVSPQLASSKNVMGNLILSVLHDCPDRLNYKVNAVARSGAFS